MVFIDKLTLLCSFVALAVAAYFDIKSFRIPNKLTFPVMTVGLILSVFLSPAETLRRAAAIILLFFFGMLHLMGMGDLKLCMAITALRGWQEMLYMILGACVSMLLYCVLKNPKKSFYEIKAAFICMFWRMPPIGGGQQYPFSVFLLVGYAAVQALLLILWSMTPPELL